MLMAVRQRLVPALVAWSTIVANITIIVGLLIAYWTYDQSRKSSRIDKSLDYVERFNSDQILDARNTIYRVWKDYDLATRAPGGSRAVIDAIVERVTEDHDTNGPERSIKTAIINIATFFDSVLTCAKAEVCDQGILQAQLGPYARSFHCLYAQWISAEREHYNLPGLGYGLVELAQSEGSC